MQLDIFQHPEELTDEELEAEYEAVHSDSFSEVIECEGISDILKENLLSHRFEVEREKQFRDEGNWVYPLYEFDLFDM